MRIEELADVCQTQLSITRDPNEENEVKCLWKVGLVGCDDVGEGCSLAEATDSFLDGVRGKDITVTKGGTPIVYYIPTTIEDHFV
jgi:hypothetical protein